VTNQPINTNQVSDEELAFLEASVALDRAWDHLLHVSRCNCEQAEIESATRQCIELEHTKHSLYRCWKENHPSRYEDGSIRFVGGEHIDDTCERCAVCGRKIKPRTSLCETPGNEVPVIP